MIEWPHVGVLVDAMACREDFFSGGSGYWYILPIDCNKGAGDVFKKDRAH